MNTISENELATVMQHLVPAGLHNRQAVRFMRRFFTSLLDNISATDIAAIAAQAAKECAQTAQTDATQALEDADALSDLVLALQQALVDHEGTQAGNGILGHVTQGAAVGVVGPLGVPPAPLVYSPAQIDQITAAVNALQAKVDALCASLQNSGAIA